MPMLDFAFELLFVLLIVMFLIISIVFIGAVVAGLIFGSVALVGWVMSMNDGGGIVD